MVVIQVEVIAVGVSGGWTEEVGVSFLWVVDGAVGVSGDRDGSDGNGGW